jgi:hypothetical protein
MDETPLFLDGIFSELMNEQAMAAADAEILHSKMIPEEEEKEDLEDDDGFEVQSISFAEQEHGQVMQALDE